MTETQELSKEEQDYKNKFIDFLYWVALQNRGKADLRCSFMVADFTKENEQEVNTFLFSGEQTGFGDMVATVFSVVERELPIAREALIQDVVKCIDCLDEYAKRHQIREEDLQYCVCEDEMQD
jgi:hypothetical protein